MAPYNGSSRTTTTVDTLKQCYTLDEWLADIKRAIFYDARRTIGRFNRSLPFVRRCLYCVVDITMHFMVVALALFLCSYAWPSTSSTRWGWWCVGAFSITVVWSVALSTPLIWAKTHRRQYRDFLFDAQKWWMIRVPLRHDVEAPSRTTINRLTDEVMQLNADNVMQLLRRQQPGDIELLRRQLHSCVMLSWSDEFLARIFE